jgi:hypothetical protein
MWKTWRSASIIPYTAKSDNEIYFLLGQENKSSFPKSEKWSSFGGMNEKKIDNSPLETALREFDEESMGALGDIEVVKQYISPLIYFDDGHYSFFLLYPDTDISVQIYNRILAKMQPCTRKKKVGDKEKEWIITVPSCATDLLEKSSFKWFPLETILQAKDNKVFRGCFLQNLRKIFNLVDAREIMLSWKQKQPDIELQNFLI